MHFISIISSSGRLVWSILWCAAVTYKLSQDSSRIFRKDWSLRRLSLQTPSTNYDSNHHKERASKLLIRISKRLCCGVFRCKQTLLRSISLPDWLLNWTHFNNLRLLLVYQSVMLEFIHFFFDTSPAIEILIDTLIFSLSQPTLLIFQRFFDAPFV